MSAEPAESRRVDPPGGWADVDDHDDPSRSTWWRRSRRRRIVFVNASGHFAGAEAMLVDLVIRLDPLRWQPLVVIPSAGPLAEELRTAGIETRVHPLATLGSRVELRSIRALLRRAASLPPSVAALARLARAERAALIHSNSSVVLDGALAAAAAGIPHVWHVREVLTRPAAAWRLLRFVIPAVSSRVVCVSEGVRRHFGRLPDALARRLAVVHDGVPMARPAYAATGELGWDPATPVVGTVGRINGHKGQEDFLRAAALVSRRHPRVRFAVVGGALEVYAGLERQIHLLAAELGIGDRVRFLGHLSHERVRRLLPTFTIFVAPSRIVEGFGLAALEAMAAGVPLVATDIGARELVRDGQHGLLVPSADPAALAAALDALLTAPARAAQLGCSGRAHAQAELTIERHVEGVERVYADAMDVGARLAGRSWRAVRAAFGLVPDGAAAR